MCPPRFFDVSYSINPWMDRSVPVDRARATAQWERLVETYEGLGHDVEIIEPVPEAPDMVFSANGAVVRGGRVLTARFRHRDVRPSRSRTGSGSSSTASATSARPGRSARAKAT